MNPYQTLGVSATAAQDEIRAAYRELAKKYHPDLNPGNKGAEQKFKDVNAAYEQVGTPESRAKHDRGEASESPNGGGRRGPFYRETQGFSFEDISDLFGEMAGARDENYRLEITLKDSILGAERELTLPGGKKLSVKIPAGVQTGSRLRFVGQGKAGARAAGDVYVELEVKPDPRFHMQGPDLEIELPISLAQAVLGGEARVPTVEGEVMVTIPRHSNTGTRLRLAHKGAYDRNRKARGDQLVTLKVVLPQTIAPELEEAIRRSAA